LEINIHDEGNEVAYIFDEMKKRYVEYLIECLESAELDNRAMKLLLEDMTEELSRSNKNHAEILEKPFTTKRKNSLHFGSDEGAKIVSAQHNQHGEAAGQVRMGLSWQIFYRNF